MTDTDTPIERLTPDELKTFFLFESLKDEQLRWLSEHGAVSHYPAGAVVFGDQEPATCFYMLVDGEQALLRRVADHDVEVSRTSQRGVYSGATRAWLAPNMSQALGQRYAGSVRAITDCTFFTIPADEFGAQLLAWFPMAMHLLEGMFMGMRTSDALIGQRERLTALGRLTAGLTHELNNPAAAAVRATSTLRERVAAMRGKLGHLASGKVDPETLAQLSKLQEEAIEKSAKAPRLTPMQANDREDEITNWFDGHGVSAGWQLAPVLVAAGLDVDWLDSMKATIPAGHLESGLKWITYALESEQLMTEIEDATDRISGLVAAAKQYSQMDRADYQTIDVHKGLESTMVMLGGKFKEKGITVVRDYDRALPEIPAYPAELNQVWTNLIDNAIQAMVGSGEHGAHGTGTLTLRTALDADFVLVEIGDTGPGVPPELQRQIFEPFFTTKPTGEGTGLGLDISWRLVVNRHGGDLRVESTPGDTRFQVRLPLVSPTRD
jgi:signal transduction histidine kinase